MARPRKNASEDTPTDTARGPSRVFARRPAGDRGALTHDSIAADLDAFHRAGGTIEVLGTTATLRKIGQADTTDLATETAAKAAKANR